MPPSLSSSSSSSSNSRLPLFLFLLLHLFSPLPAAVQLGGQRGSTGEVAISTKGTPPPPPTHPPTHSSCMYVSCILPVQCCWRPASARCHWTSCDHTMSSPSFCAITCPVCVYSQVKDANLKQRQQRRQTLSFLSGSCPRPEDVIQRYMEEVSAAPDEVKLLPLMTASHSSCADSRHLVLPSVNRFLSRTVSSAWTSCPARPAMSCRLRTRALGASCPAPWASLSSAATLCTCSACWPCTTTEPRYQKLTLQADLISLVKSLIKRTYIVSDSVGTNKTTKKGFA